MTCTGADDGPRLPRSRVGAPLSLLLRRYLVVVRTARVTHCLQAFVRCGADLV